MVERLSEPSERIERHQAVIVGAGPAGLSAAAMLGQRGVETLVLERAHDVGASWRSHGERLHLHIVRWLSGLPGMSIDRSEGPWVSREGVVRYLEEYARRFRLNVRTGTEVLGLHRKGNEWLLTTGLEPFVAHWVVVATGFNRDPSMPDWPGRDWFEGELIHSSGYRNAEPYRGRDVLVVGTGNSGAEICVDLVEGGAGEVSLSVRTPPQHPSTRWPNVSRWAISRDMGSPELPGGCIAAPFTTTRSPSWTSGSSAC